MRIIEDNVKRLVGMILIIGVENEMIIPKESMHN